MLLRKTIWVVTILWMIAIFFFSSRTGDLSRQDSAWLLDRVNITTQEEAMDTDNSRAMSLQMWIRKTAHIIIFAGLAMLIYASLYGYVGKSLMTGVVSWLLTIIFAITDEIHQYFVPGRGSQVQDVIRDGKGAFWGCLIMVILFLIIEWVPAINKIINKIYNLNAKKLIIGYTKR
ncbi:MAG: VanZ family protein [Epulopiscium sp.]|nr:VanZ family protein [Candidatus Epulonipiscium sp.]